MFFFQRGLKNSYRTLCLTFHLSGVQKLDPSFRNLHQGGVRVGTGPSQKELTTDKGQRWAGLRV